MGNLTDTVVVVLVLALSPVSESVVAEGHFLDSARRFPGKSVTYVRKRRQMQKTTQCLETV